MGDHRYGSYTFNLIMRKEHVNTFMIKICYRWSILLLFESFQWTITDPPLARGVGDDQNNTHPNYLPQQDDCKTVVDIKNYF